MIINTSAIVASLAGEPEADRIRAAIINAAECRMSAFNVFECRTVLTRRFSAIMLGEFELLLVNAGIEIDPFDADQAILAHRAYQRFGKGTGHPAQLNLGDCAAYALASSKRLPLLFKGNDFKHTDVEPCL